MAPLLAVKSSSLCTPGTGVSLWGDLPSPKATARQKVPCTRTYGVHVNEYYQKYEPKAMAEGDRMLMSKIRKGFTQSTKNPACPFADGRYESSRETRNRQRLITKKTGACLYSHTVDSDPLTLAFRGKYRYRNIPDPSIFSHIFSIYPPSIYPLCVIPAIC